MSKLSVHLIRVISGHKCCLLSPTQEKKIISRGYSWWFWAFVFEQLESNENTMKPIMVNEYFHIHRVFMGYSNSEPNKKSIKFSTMKIHVIFHDLVNTSIPPWNITSCFSRLSWLLQECLEDFYIIRESLWAMNMEIFIRLSWLRLMHFFIRLNPWMKPWKIP